MSQAKSFNLQAVVNQLMTDANQGITSGTYDQTKTSLVNRVQQRTVAGGTIPTLGASPVSFLSTQDLVGTPNPVAHAYSPDVVSGNVARIFVPLVPAAAIITIAYFDYNFVTGVWSYIGKLAFTLNTATTHTIRSIVIDDNAGANTGWSVHIVTTNATVGNGGYFFVPALVAKADFVTVGFATLPTATTGDTQASKKVFWLQETGGTNLLQIALGTAVDTASKVMYIGQATSNTIFYKFTYSNTITTVGASGITTDLFNFKTGANTTFSVALIQANTMKLAVPKTSQNNALIGQKCIYLSTTATGYHFLVSDLSSGSTTVPSLVQWNKLGTGVDWSALPVAYSFSQWSNVLDMEVNYSTSGVWMMKRSINNDPNMTIFGRNDLIYSEVAGTKNPKGFAGATIGGFAMVNGIILANSTAVTQRGFYALDASVDHYFVDTVSNICPPSYIISPVISVDCIKALALAVTEEYAAASAKAVIQYRTSNFNVFPGTWTTLPMNGDYSSVGGLTGISQIQTRFLFNVLSDFNANSFQLGDAYLVYTATNELSDKWEGSVDNSTQANISPAYTAFRMTSSDSGTKYFRAYDDNGVLIASANTSTDYAMFSKTTNNGTSWSVMTGANDYSSTALTTEIRYNWATPPGVKVTCSLRDS